MPSINLRDAFIPIYLRGLQNASHILSKVEAHAKDMGIEECRVMRWRLAPDMAPMGFRVLAICEAAQDIARLMTGGTRTSGLSEDLETTFVALHHELHAAIGAVSMMQWASFDTYSHDSASVMVRCGVAMLEFVQKFMVPKFFSHFSMLYALSRSHRVPIGTGWLFVQRRFRLLLASVNLTWAFLG
jgi:uncharacterized protein